MSWRATSWAAEQKTGSPISKLVLLKLADNANDEGVCWPSLDTIADHTELSRRTVQDHLTRLEGMGMIAVEERKAESGASMSNRYHLAMPAPGKRAKGEGASAASPQGAAGAREGAADNRGRVQLTASPIDEPPSEPSKEPPHTGAPDGAGEGVTSLGQEDFTLWPAFRAAIAETWPDGFPRDNEAACKIEFGKLTRSVRGDKLVEIARLHGQELVKRKASRPKSAARMLFKAPASWLRSGDWEGYAGAAEEAKRAESLITSAIGRVQRGLGPVLFDWLRNVRGIADASLAKLDGSILESGPPPVLLVTTNSAMTVLARHQSALERVLGVEGLTITQVPHVRSA